MKEVKLLKLELTNYRNIEHEVYVFGGSNAKIVGENRIGKTNTLEAIYVLLTNYLLDGSSDLTAIKPLSDTKKEVRIEGTFEVKDGDDCKEITLGKAYGEKWVKQRGSETLSMQGHYEDYFVNGIKQSKEKDYHEVLFEFFGIRNDEKGEIDKIQMLTNPLYLGNLGEGDTKQWQMLRTFIVKLIGDVDDEEIFKSAPATLSIKQDLTNALGKTDQLKKMYQNDIETLNGQLSGFDSQVKLLEETSKPTDEDVALAKAKIEEIDGKIANIKLGDKDAVEEQLKEEIFKLDKEIVEKHQKELNEYSAMSSEETTNSATIDALNKDIAKKVDENTDIKIKKSTLEYSIKTKSNTKAQLVEEWKAVSEQFKTVDSQIVSVCPTCGRPFDESEVEGKKKELTDKLTARKELITKQGQALKVEIEGLEKDIESLDSRSAELNKEIEFLRGELAKYESKTPVKAPYVESAELSAMRVKLTELKDKLTAHKTKVSEQASNKYELIEKYELEKQPLQKVIADRDYYDRQMELLKNVEAEKGKVSKQLIAVEQKREALKTYLYTKLRLLNEHIAKVFGNLRFQLIKENINGGFDPVCKAYIYDVDKDKSTDVLWKSGSKSEKIITGITIAEAIKKHLGLTELPYLFDEGGEISNETLRSKFKTNAQIICVRVEDNINKPVIVKF